MYRKFAVLSFLVACFTVVLWSTVALAEEKEQESREAQIKQLRGQIGELEQALERADTDKETAELKGKLQERRLFRRGEEEIRVCWATHPSEISIQTQNPLTIVNIVGREKTLIPETGRIILTLDENPVYVKGAAQEVVEIDVGPKVLADSIFDYSKNQGGNNWFYGYYDAKGDGVEPSASYTDDDFAQMEQVQTMWGYNWAGPAQYLKLDRDGGHPEISGDRQLWAVRRWRSTYSGMVRIEGSFKGGGSKGDGTEVRIFIDGEQIYRTLAGGKSSRESAEFDLAVQIKDGSLVDFAITPGPPGSDQQYDASELSIRITVMELKGKQ